MAIITTYTCDANGCGNKWTDKEWGLIIDSRLNRKVKEVIVYRQGGVYEQSDADINYIMVCGEACAIKVLASLISKL